MKGTLFLDNVWITNLILDFLMLTLTCNLTGTTTTFFRKLLGAGLGASSYCLTILFFRKLPVFVALTEGIAVILMFLVASRQKEIKRLPEFAGYYFCCSFFVGGFMLFLKRILNGYLGATGSLLALLTGLIGTGIAWFFGWILWKKKSKRFCKVVLKGDDREICVKALVDTGNGLKDPISGRGAAILEKEIWDHMKSFQKEEKYKVLPYSSVGKKHGMLEGYEIDQMKLEDQMLKHMIVAIYPGHLSGRRSYQMILPPEWIR